MTWKYATAAFLTGAFAIPSQAQTVLTGDYLQVSVNNALGTFGQGSVSPAFVHDPSGTGSFNLSTDYISPGTPHDGFSLISDQFGMVQNDNAGIGHIAGVSFGLLTGSAANGFANAASWSGNYAGLFNITNSYFFNDGDERVLITSTITALTNLTNLAFARSVDPDSGGFSSINQRGNTTFNANDLIGSESPTNGRTLALVNLSGNVFEHTTSINGSCCSNIDPYVVLANGGSDRGLSSTGDHGLNLAYRIGALNSGQSATLTYAYAAGLGIEEIVDVGTGVPEPSTWAMLILGFLGTGAAMRARKSRPALRYV